MKIQQNKNSVQKLMDRSRLYLFLKSCESLGDIYNLTGAYKEAIKNYERMLRFSNDIIIQTRSRRKIAEVYGNQGRLDDALKILRSGLGILKGNAYDVIIEKTEIHILRCRVLMQKGKLEEAMREDGKGLEMIEKTGVDDKRMKSIKAKGFNNLAAISYVKGEYDRAIELFEKYLKISEEIGDKREIGNASSNLGIVYQERGEYDKTIELFNKDLKISEEIGNKPGIGMISGNLGNVYFEIGEYNKAIELYENSLKISEEIGDKQGIGIASGGLGAAHLEIDKLKEAEKYLRKSKKSLEQIGDKYYLIYTYCPFSELIIKRGGRLENALEKMAKALKLAKEIDSKDGRAFCYFTYGKVYAQEVKNRKSGVEKAKQKNELRRGMEYFKKAIKVYQELKKKKSLADCYLEYAKMLKEIEELRYLKLKEKAEIYFNKALKIYQELKLNKKIKEIEKNKESEVLPP